MNVNFSRLARLGDACRSVKQAQKLADEMLQPLAMLTLAKLRERLLDKVDKILDEEEK